jgi:hypothetical protein
VVVWSDLHPRDDDGLPENRSDPDSNAPVEIIRNHGFRRVPVEEIQSKDPAAAGVIDDC